jgi:hypothetical protein
MLLSTTLLRPLIVGIAALLTIPALQFINTSDAASATAALASAPEAPADPVRLVALVLSLALLMITCLVIALRGSTRNTSPAVDVFARLHLEADRLPTRPHVMSSR